MKLKRLALAVAMLSPLSFQTLAAVNLDLPANIRLLAVNEEEANKGWDSFLKSSAESIRLEDGQNQIVYQIDHYFYKGDKQSERFRSGPFILTFEAKDKDLVFSIPDFHDVVHAEGYEKSPTPVLKRKSGSDYPFKHDKLALQGLSINHDYAEYVQAYNKTGGIAALAAAGAVISQASAPAKTAQVQQTAKPNAQADRPVAAKAQPATDTHQQQSELAAENLKFWFNQADEQTRKEFINWAINNL
ncbi:DUF2057 domain-containing protein [Photobacterium rosenbergii]|uniref:UPF0319 protein R2X38_19355 n=1 Tax=Photobacterium rosenbergii TaxID=294936 RepID=A0ABU3ZMF0_9GAMM|nr:DUF2057 domain-containing protein [Photobacterium rosenbergii]MDV5171158.1 DUF2057 domain-containing protein [Photobacterium rosenbergii]